MKKFNKLHLVLFAGIILSIIGGLLLQQSARNCDSITLTPGTAAVTYTCPLNSTELTEAVFSRNDVFMLEKTLFGVGIGLILIWLVSLVSIKLGSTLPTRK